MRHREDPRRRWPPPGRSTVSLRRSAPAKGSAGTNHDDLFAGTERFFRPGYLASLTTSWIPALDGVDDKLRRGGWPKLPYSGRSAAPCIS